MDNGENVNKSKANLITSKIRMLETLDVKGGIAYEGGLD